MRRYSLAHLEIVHYLAIRTNWITLLVIRWKMILIKGGLLFQCFLNFTLYCLSLSHRYFDEEWGGELKFKHDDYPYLGKMEDCFGMIIYLLTGSYRSCQKSVKISLYNFMYWNVIERVNMRLHVPPCPTPKICWFF